MHVLGVHDDALLIEQLRDERRAHRLLVDGEGVEHGGTLSASDRHVGGLTHTVVHCDGQAQQRDGGGGYMTWVV